MAYCRPARKDEDETLARILDNASRLTWDTNWMQGLSNPLETVQIENSAKENLNKEQYARLEFYRAVLRLSRYIDAQIDVVALPEDHNRPASVSIWWPPHVRGSFWSELWTGWLRVCCLLGFSAARRLVHFNAQKEELRRSAASKIGRNEADGAYVTIVGTDPGQAGHGYAAQLLRWQIERHKAELPGVPIYIGTANDYATKVYERLGFRELARDVLPLQVDRNGFRRKASTIGQALAEFTIKMLILE